MDSVQQSQRLQQVGHTQQLQPQQGIRKPQSFGFTFGNAIRSLIPAGPERARLKDDNSSLQQELSNVRRELEEYKARFDVVQEAGSEGPRALPTKANSLSISDVIDKVGVVNEEIFQAAASLAQALVHSRRQFTTEDMQRGREQVCKLISEPIVNLLINQAQQPEPEVNPFIAQAVLSIFLVGFCVAKLNSWYPGDTALDAFLGTLYNEIRTSEEQAVSGRWRALTRSRTRPTTDNWMAEVIEKLKSLLVVAAWDTPTDHRVAFEQKIIPIFKAVEGLRIVLGEKFTSADLEVNVVPAGSKFEDWKEDEREEGPHRQANREVVAGTTGMGLKKILILKGSRHPEEEEIILPPKVVLESTLRKAFELPPTESIKMDQQAHLDGKEDVYWGDL